MTGLIAHPTPWFLDDSVKFRTEYLYVPIQSVDIDKLPG